jgi:hypothetical protein
MRDYRQKLSDVFNIVSLKLNGKLLSYSTEEDEINDILKFAEDAKKRGLSL